MISLGSQAQFIMEVKCKRLDWQLSSMMQIFSQQLPLLSHIEQLKLREGIQSKDKRWKDVLDMEPSLWLELFHLFIAMQSSKFSFRE